MYSRVFPADQSTAGKKPSAAELALAAGATAEALVQK
jgi:hypothetical protein